MLKKKRSTKKKHVQKKEGGKVQWWAVLALVAAVVIVLTLVFQDKTPPAEVAATVNGEAITVNELSQQYERLPPQYKALVTKSALLAQIVDERLLFQEAKRQKYLATDREIFDIIRQSVVLSGVTEEEFYSQLASQNLSREYLEEFYKKQVSINKLLNDTILEKIEVSAAEKEQFYQENAQQFVVPEQREASHILYLVTEEQDDATALAKAQSAYREATPENFADIAREESDDQGSAARGGFLGAFGRGQMVPEFETAAFTLEEGDISKPVRTQFGYHLIHVTGVIPARTLTLAEVDETIEAQVSSEKQRQLYEEFINKLRAEATIELLYVEAPQVEGVKTFQATGDAVCADGEGKPIVRMFSLTTCPHCQWIRETFNTVVSEYALAGKISAYHWQLDTGDNELTPEVETKVPAEELAVFEKYSPGKQVPLFIFGCESKRVGNGYERENDLVKEELEFRALLDGLTA